MTINKVQKYLIDKNKLSNFESENKMGNMSRIRFVCFIVTLLLFSGINIFGQQRNGRERWIGVSSPVVNSDNTVTFNYLAPNAKDVKVNVQFAGTKDMVKGENGVWTVTLGPVDPDMYPYSFIVDGTTIMDPHNPAWFPNERFKNSLVDIRGNKPLIHSVQNVPHGAVNYDNYYSNTLGQYSQVLVYTPPFYDQNPNKHYPVFYLISGTTDTEETYFKVGRVNFILDNLIAQKLAKEMIVVMPYGNPTFILPKEQQKKLADTDAFSDDLIKDLMPYIEKTYRTINDRDHRGIGGFSRGGHQALQNGLGHLDLFSNICSYSSFLETDYVMEHDKALFDNPKKTNSQIHLFWLGVGKDDFLYEGAKQFMDLLDQHQIKNVKVFTEGKFGHTWMNAKYFLDRSFRLLFKNQ